MSSEVKHYWPEEIVGTGELVVYLQDYAALEAENARLRQAMQGMVEALTEAVEYLDSSYLNSIRAGSKLHVFMRCVLPALNSKQEDSCHEH